MEPLLIELLRGQWTNTTTANQTSHYRHGALFHRLRRAANQVSPSCSPVVTSKDYSESVEARLALPIVEVVFFFFCCWGVVWCSLCLCPTSRPLVKRETVSLQPDPVHSCTKPKLLAILYGTGRL